MLSRGGNADSAPKASLEPAVGLRRHFADHVRDASSRLCKRTFDPREGLSAREAKVRRIRPP